MTRRHWLGPALLALFAAGTAWGQARFQQFQEPQLLRLQITDVSMGVIAVGTHEETKANSSSQTFTYDHIFVAPTLGLGLQGSTYHPNMIQFQFVGDGGYGWSDQRSKPSTTSTKDTMWYGMFNGSAGIFSGKPLNGTVFANYGQTYRETDFFNHSTVETLGYGSRTAFSAPGLSLMASYTHTDEDSVDTAQSSSQHQDVASFNARNDRATGTASFDYTYNLFNSSGQGQGGTATQHNFTLTDSEQFGSQKQIQLQTGAAYSHNDSDTETSDNTSANAALNIQHQPNLASDYSASYDRSENGSFVGTDYYGNAEVRHQLYASLASTLFGNVIDSESSDTLNDGYNRQYGGGLSENYTKRLSPDHRLEIYNTASANYVEQKGTGRVENERHTFPLPPNLEAFQLNQPNVIEPSIIVTDANGLQQFQLGLDYQVFRNGTLTEIRRTLGGNIPQGATVLVDYLSTPTGSGNYESFTDVAGIRLDLWQNLWSLYARMNLVRNTAPSDVLALDQTSYAVGTDVTWRWLRAGAEYDTYDSTESSYWSMRFYQSGLFQPDAASSFSVNFSESYTEYTDTSRAEQDYRFITRYHRSLSGNLQFDLAGGVDQRHGEDVDQTLAVTRLEVNYQIGRTTVQLMYDFAYNLYLHSEEQEKHMLMLRLKRRF